MITRESTVLKIEAIRGVDSRGLPTVKYTVTATSKDMSVQFRNVTQEEVDTLPADNKVIASLANA